MDGLATARWATLPLIWVQMSSTASMPLARRAYGGPSVRVRDMDPRDITVLELAGPRASVPSVCLAELGWACATDMCK